MASLMDLSSSPDPLGEDIAASVRPSTIRRSAKSLQPPSYLQSSARSLPSSAKSPRRQTFELDVGNPGSPQRLLVTVEADEQRGRRSAVSRRLFADSPTRSPSRGRGTTTTTVPLKGLSDDEGGEQAPRRRGRPRGSLGSKNGTPAPRGKKRAGTPLHRTATAKRRSGDPAADSTILSDALAEADSTAVGDPTPKPKPRTRKTPKKAGTPAVPTSKQTTGRKRGRPRKALMPDEMAVLASEAALRSDNADMLPNEDVPMPGDAPSEAGIHVGRNDIPPTDELARDDVNGPSDPLHPPGAALDSEPVDGESVHGGLAGSYDAPYSEDYMPLADPHSDFESEAGDVDGLTYSGQDNLTHASEFSMITLENLPSFQASFQGNLSRISEGTTEFPEAGEETNFIINQTLESLRRSTQTESQDQSHHDLPPHQGQQKEATTVESPAGDTRNSSANLGSSQNSWIRSSARRLKQLPLSRQVFSSTKAPHVDDSFSSIAEGGLPAATPRRLPMSRPAADTANEHPDMYEDSFSEIPDDVLLAATPKPASRTATAAHVDQEDHSDPPTSDREPQSASRSTNIGSDRLPTPDDTNSSATDAGKNTAGEGTQGVAAVDVSVQPDTSDLNIRSSPPTISRQFNTMKLLSEASPVPPTISRQFNTMNIESDTTQPEQDAAGTPRRKSSSPQLPPTQSATAELANNTLQPPAAIRRPTLSPIVRAGRTLQNIMSDRSSPEGRESSLGSPFRGPVQNDSRQSSVTKSPGRDAHQSNSQLLFNPIASLSQSIRSAFGSSHRSGPTSVPAPAPTSAPAVAQADDPFGLDMPDYSETEALRRSAYGVDNGEASAQGDQPAEFFPSVTSSTRAALPSSENDGIDWLANQSSPATQRFRRMSASQRSAHSSFLSTRGTRTHLRVHVEQPDEQDETDDQEDQEPQEEAENEQREIEQAEQEEEEEEDEQEEEENEQKEEAKEEEDEDEGVDQDVEDQLEDEEHHGEGHTQLDLAHALIDEPQQEEDGVSDQGMADVQDDEDDEMDLWDIEASRPTPRSTKVLRDEAQSPRQTQPQPQTLSPAPGVADLSTADTTSIPPRRTKIPSPWRRSTRRLIYQDDFKDPSEIEMEDSPPSDMEVVAPEPLAAALREQPQEQMQEHPLEQGQEQYEATREQHRNLQEDIGEGSQEMDEDLPDYAEPHYDDSDGGSYDVEPQEVAEPEHPSRVSQPQKHDVSMEESTMEDYSMASQHKAPEQPVQEQKAPARRSFFGGFDIMSFFSSPRPPPTKTVVGETPTQEAASRPLPRPIHSVEKPVPEEEPRSALRAPGLFPSIPQKAFNPSPERRVDLFSPGAPLRSADTVRTVDLFSPSSPLRPAESVPGISSSVVPRRQPSFVVDTGLSSPAVPRKQPSFVADAGLFSPALPRTQPNVVADADLSSPGGPRGQPNVANTNSSPGDALRSTDTVADTYAEAPSTPERGAFPPILQKRNFTPLSGQSRNTASLFTPSQQGSTPARDTKTPSPENDFPQEPGVSDEISSDQTDEPSFEHIPPREKPSNWDRTLSPTKSCLRSPLKPKTPGRVVEFTSNVLAPDAEARDDRQRALNTLNNFGNGGFNVNRGNALLAQRPILPAPVRVPEGNKENSLSPPIRSPRRVVSFDGLAPAPRLAANTGNANTMANSGSRSPAKQVRTNNANPSTSSPRARLSPTNWTREHWIRLDELARLRRTDSLRFQMQFGGSSKQHPLVGMEVATGQASLILEPWHMEVVAAFRDAVLELPGGGATFPWDDRALAKRLFALLVGEERRRRGEIVSSYATTTTAADKGKGKAVAVAAAATANPGPTSAAGAAAAAAMAKVAGRGQRTAVRTSPRRR